MSYATQSDLEQRLSTQKLVDLTDFQEVGELNADRITAALSAASGMIDAYAGGRYALPLAVSEQLKDLCVDLTIYKLYVGRQRPVPEIVQQGYDNAIAFLRDVSSGKAQLSQPEAEQAAREST